MPVCVDVEHPDDNSILLSPEFLAHGSGLVSVRGRGNTIRIDEPYAAGASHFHLTGGATVTVGPGCNLGGVVVHALAEGAAVEIGEGTSFNAVTQITVHEAARVSIGAHCLFGAECYIAASDVHKILDAKTGERLNLARDIELGDHVWVSARCAIFRGSIIGRDSVVGYGSVVKGTFPPGAMLAGVPARLVKEGITWLF